MRVRLLLVMLIAVAVAWVGREIVTFGYIMLLDDDRNIFFNPHLGVPDVVRLHWMFTDMVYVHRYMPLGWLGFCAAYILSGLEPWGYHVAGVMFHALNGVLFFLILERLLRRFAAESDGLRRAMAAAGVALLWALHPLRVEVTAWCSGLLYTQGTCFAMVAFYARLIELEARLAGQKRRAFVWFLVALSSFAASALTYPVLLFLPLVIAMVDRAWLRNAPGVLRRRVSLGAGWLGLVALGAAGATLVSRVATDGNSLPLATLADFGLLGRTLQSVYVAAVYLWRGLWPVGLNPVGDTVFNVTATRWIWWAAVVTVAGCSWGAWRMRRAWPFVGACWLGYLVLLSPSLGFTEHPYTVADRYSYGTSLALGVALAFALVRISAGWRSVMTVSLVLGAAVATGFLSVRQARAWRDSSTLHRFVLSMQSDEDVGRITRVRAAKLDFLRGEVAAARALVWEEWQAAQSNAGVARTWREMAPLRALSAEEAARPLQEWSAPPYAHLHLQIAREQLKEDYGVEALAHLDAALALAPGFSAARFLRGMLLAEMAQPRAAIHDWLALSADLSNGSHARRKYLGEKIADALTVCGEPKLAERLRQSDRAALSSSAFHSTSDRAVAEAISSAVRR